MESRKIVITQHLSLLGKRVQDKVTGLKGIVTSISFDLYGCIQTTLHPGIDKDGKVMDQSWFDVNRLEVLSEVPVMEPPDFEQGKQAEGKQGANDKPRFLKT